MPTFDRTIPITLLSADAGTVDELRAKEYDADGVIVDSEISAGFTRIGTGLSFLLTRSYTIASGDVHFVKVYLDGSEDEEIGVTPVAPAESSSGGGGGEGTGTGDIAVDHNYGGTDALRIIDADSQPVDGAIIRAYVAADYAAGTIDNAPPTTLTGSDGRWVAPLMLDADDYTVTVYNPATKRTKNFSLTVEE